MLLLQLLLLLLLLLLPSLRSALLPGAVLRRITDGTAQNTSAMHFLG